MKNEKMLTQQDDDAMWEGLFCVTANFEGLTIWGSEFSRGHFLPPPPPCNAHALIHGGTIYVLVTYAS